MSYEGLCDVGLYVHGLYLLREMLKEDRTATIVVDEPQVKMQIQQEEEKISVKRVSGPRGIVSIT